MPPTIPTSLTGWGGGPGVAARILRPREEEALIRAVSALRAAPGQGAIPRGMGRSYGDAAQLAGGVVLDTSQLKDFSLDTETGVVVAQAGVTLGELLAEVVPAGWMVPVVPGTQHVTVAGAIASDIHGKNHGTAGTFGSYVRSLGLLTAAGETVTLGRGEDDEALLATIGGMGLTGVILWAEVALAPVQSALLSVDVDRVDDLDAALEVLSEPGGPHRVAWVDLLGRRPWRGIVTRAEHAAGQGRPDGAAGATVPARARVPAGFPAGLLHPATVLAQNELRLRLAPRRERGRLERLGAHMFPLDGLEAWPHLYGPGGFVQYQLVVPRGAEAVLSQTAERLRRARVPCYLAVLKDFGPANDAPLSFPFAGWTLALDLPRSADNLLPVLDELDELVGQAGGRVYLTKDSRLRPETVAAMYPRLAEWRQARDQLDPEGLWRSDLSERTHLVQAAPAASPSPPRPRAAPAPSHAGAGPQARRVLVLGGTSEIGLAIARRLGAEGPIEPYLLGRGAERLAEALSDLRRAGAQGGGTEELDAADLAAHAPALDRVFERSGGFDLVVLAVGVLAGQEGLDTEPALAGEVMHVDFTACGSLLLETMRRLRQQGSGTVVVLSSVAGERARASNAIYGAAKAGLDALAQGLADAAVETGPRVLVVRPGFVTTRMTEGLDPAPFSTTPEAVAEATVSALATGAHTVWVPGVLRFVFSALRHLPRPLYRRLPL